MKLQEQVPLAPLTTLGVGGPARYLVEGASSEEVREALELARRRDWPLFVLGGGSNLVVSDRGWPGLVLKVAIQGIQESERRDRVLFDVGAGEEWDRFVAHTVARNCSGIECLSGIPGTVGGTPVQNVGAYGQEVAETIVSLRVLDRRSGEVGDFSNPQCQFAYRSSRFNTAEPGRYIVLGVRFALRRDGQPRLAYADLQRYFAGNSAPGLAQVREAVLAIRRNKGMLLVEGDPDCRSAGSFFRNPVLSPQQYAGLQQRAASRRLTVPSYTALPPQRANVGLVGDPVEAQHKVSAAWLVEQAGFPKGLTRGAVGISSKHALAIINRGGASAADVLALKAEIERAVCQQFGIELRPEPVFVGF